MKNIFKVLGINISMYLILIFIYKFITAFPPEEATIVENNLFSKIYLFLIISISFLTSIFNYIFIKNEEKLLFYLSIITTSLLNGFLYFLSNFIIFSLNEEINSLFVNNNAIGMLIVSISTILFTIAVKIIKTK